MLKKVYLISSALFATLYIALSSYPKSFTVKPTPAMPVQYQPNHIAVNKIGYCTPLEYARYNESVVRCETEHFNYNYDQTNNVIIYSTLALKDYTIGDLILIYGTPIGYRNNYGVTRVFWHNKHAFMISKGFSPKSKAFFLAFTPDKNAVYWKWTGFSLRKTE